MKIMAAAFSYSPAEAKWAGDVLLQDRRIAYGSFAEDADAKQGSIQSLKSKRDLKGYNGSDNSKLLQLTPTAGRAEDDLISLVPNEDQEAVSRIYEEATQI